MNKKLVSAGLLAGLVAGTGAGFVMQQTGLVGATDAVTVAAPDTTTGSTDPASTGTGTDTSTDAPAPDRGARLQDVLAPLVAAGTITQAQADAVVQAMLDAAPFGGPGGHRGPGGPGGPGGLHHGERGQHLTVAAAAIGISEDALRTALRSGSTIADVATANGVDVQVVIDAVVADVKADIAQHVTDGDLTQAEADARLTDVEARVTDLVNGVRPERPAGAPDGDADDAVPTTTG